MGREDKLKEHRDLEHSDIIHEACEDCSGIMLLAEKNKHSHKCIKYVLEVMKMAIG